MKIRKCHICERPYFLTITATGASKLPDPDACPNCNKIAKENSEIKD